MPPTTTTYVALADEIEREMASLEPGSRLPSEHDLAGRHQVSRVTARSALQELAQRHAVRRTRGSGTYVALRIPYPVRPGALPSWSQIVRAAGHVPSYRIRAVDTVDAPVEVARRLLIRPEEPVVNLKRVGLVDGQVAGVSEMWFPASLVPDLGDHLDPTTSVTGVLGDQYGVASERWWSQAELASPPAEAAAMLELVGRPLAWRMLTVNRCSRRQVPIEYSHGWMRADCFRVFLEVGPTDGVLPTATPNQGTNEVLP